MRAKGTVTNKDMHIEKVGINLEADVTKEGAEKLVSEGGLDGNLAVAGVSQTDQFWDALKTSAVKPKAKAKNTARNAQGKGTAPLTPFTPKDIAISMMNQMLKEGASARATCVAIAGLEYSRKLARQMNDFAQGLEEQFETTQSKVMNT